jgi:hypothetical protein
LAVGVAVLMILSSWAATAGATSKGTIEKSIITINNDIRTWKLAYPRNGWSGADHAPLVVASDKLRRDATGALRYKRPDDVSSKRWTRYRHALTTIALGAATCARAAQVDDFQTYTAGGMTIADGDRQLAGSLSSGPTRGEGG